MDRERIYLVLFLVNVMFVATRKNEWNVSKGDPDPTHFWTFSTTKHDDVCSSNHTYAYLHNVTLFDGEDRFSNVTFHGSNESYIYINNSNEVFDGTESMSWMMYVQPDSNFSDNQTTTLLKYENENEESLFHLEILPNLKMSCTLKTTKTTYNVVSGIELQYDVKTFIGINFNFDWNKQFDFFEVYTAADGKQKSVQDKIILFSDVNNTEYLDLKDADHIRIGRGFRGTISCLQYYNTSIINNPQKNAPLLCDPVLAVNDTFGDHTTDYIEAVTADTVQTTQEETTTYTPASEEVTTTPALTTEELTTTSALTTEEVTTMSAFTTEEVTTTSALTTEEVPTTSALTTEEVTTTSALTTEELTTTPALTTDELTTTSALTTDELTTTSVLTTDELTTTSVLTTVPPITTQTTTTSNISPDYQPPVAETCVVFRKIANDTSISNPIVYKIVNGIPECAKLCGSTTSCHVFGTEQTFGFFHCSVGDNTYTTSSKSGSYLYAVL